MNIAFLGAAKDLKEENFEQALWAMSDVKVDTPVKKLAVLKLIAKCRETPEIYTPSITHKV